MKLRLKRLTGLWLSVILMASLLVTPAAAWGDPHDHTQGTAITDENFTDPTVWSGDVYLDYTFSSGSDVTVTQDVNLCLNGKNSSSYITVEGATMNITSCNGGSDGNGGGVYIYAGSGSTVNIYAGKNVIAASGGTVNLYSARDDLIYNGSGLIRLWDPNATKLLLQDGDGAPVDLSGFTGTSLTLSYQYSCYHGALLAVNVPESVSLTATYSGSDVPLTYRTVNGSRCAYICDQAHNHTVHFFKDLSFGAPEATLSETDPNKVFTLPSAADVGFSQEGKVFVGWSQFRDASGSLYIPGDAVQVQPGEAYSFWDLLDKINGYYNAYSIRLVGLWEDAISVALDANGGTAGSVSTVYAAKDHPMPAITGEGALPTRDFHTFAGYFDSADTGVGVRYINADGTAAANYTDETITTLYAQWTPLSYQVTLDANGGTEGSNTSATVTYGLTPDALSEDAMPTREDYTFLGYYDATEGGKQYFTAEGTPCCDWDKGEDTVLYAQWELNKQPPVVPTGLTAVYSQKLEEITLPEGWAWATPTAEVGNVGEQIHKADFAGNDTYEAASNVDVTVTVSQSGSALTVTTDKESYIVGQTVTVTVSGVTPMVMLSSGLQAPVSNQVALYKDGKQITEAQTVVDGQDLTFQVSGLQVGGHKLTAKYTGNENMADSEKTITVIVKAQPTSSSAPLTGDHSDPGMWIVLLTLSTAALFTAAAYDRRRKATGK